MDKNIYLIAFGTFGTPNGFKQSFFEIGNENVAKSIKTFDLNTNAIKLFPKSTLYGMRKEVLNGMISIAYSKYTFAKEQNSDRGGTFIGSSILFTKDIADENITIQKLNEFHNTLVEKNVENDILTVNHSNRFSVAKPREFDHMQFNMKKVEELDNFGSSNKNLVVYCETRPDKLLKVFRSGIALLNNYDSIYFTSNEEIASYVHQKAIFELAKNLEEFQSKINSAKQDRLNKIQAYINEFEDERIKLQEDRRKQLNCFKEEIGRNEKTHQENSRKINESKQKIQLIEQQYNQFSQKINEIINSLKSGKNPEEIRQLHNEQKREFMNSIYENTKSFNLGSISNPQSKTDLRLGTQHSWKSYEMENNHHHKKVRHNKSNSIAWGILLLILFILLLCTLSYFLLFSNQKLSI